MKDDDATRIADGSIDASGPSGPGEPTGPTGLQVRDRERYDVLGEHGRGGLGKVSRAYDKELGRQVAIKEMIRRGDAGEVRFLREALITARLEHPGIVPIHEAGRWPDGTPFYAMKLVSGRSLKELIEERRSVEERLALLHHVIAVADAMAYAHQRKIIHRDLKPANVIAGDFGETVVIDWGLAKDLSAAGAEPDGGAAPDRGPARGSAHAELTEAGSVLGTPMYMSPEQSRGGAVDQRADVFAIGAMLWELCSLQRVPPADPRLRDRMLRRARIDQDLAAIIAKALDPDPATRYRDAGELADDLKAFKSGARIAARSYSPLAVIAHWTRRHRALAATLAAAAALAIAGGALYVRNIAIERDRADAALAVASTERDNARLSEATALLDKDPTRARDLLAKLPLQTPRAALLRARASHGAASRVIRVPGWVNTLRRHPATSAIALRTENGELVLVDVDRGELRVVDREVQGGLTWHADQWMYARKAAGTSTVAVVTTAAPPQAIDVGSLLATPTSTLLSAAGRKYALDTGDLYALEAKGPTLIKRGVRSIAGNEHLLLVCTLADELEIKRGGVTERRTRCAKNTSTSPMVAVGGDYAALLDPATLLLARGKQSLQLPTRIEGEYKLALSTSGLLAVADFTGKTWLVRPGGSALEPGPSHPARPMSVAAAGPFAAWGYTDGVVIALDIHTNTLWKFSGHSSPALVAIDDAHRRMISAAGRELRVWQLTPSPAELLDHLPCTVFNFAPSLDGTQTLFDCDDGSVNLWSAAAGQRREVHRHHDIAFGAAWLRSDACSAGFDGRVICTDPTGATREILSGVGPIRRLKESPDHERLVIATKDGTLRELAGTLRTLFTHDAEPHQVMFSPDSRWLASGAVDGQIVVWDVAERRIRSKTKAHERSVTSLRWRDGELWSASSDGTVKHWRNEDGGLSLVNAYREQGALWYLQLLPDGWAAVLTSREVLIRRAASRGDLTLSLDRHVQHLEVSRDGRFVAATLAGEIVVIDLARRGIASIPISTSGIGRVELVGADALLISNGDGLFTVSLPELELTRFDLQRD